jgi:RecB family exonuclease
MAKKKIPKILKEIKAYKAATVNYAAGQKNISYSQISMFHRCPHQWKLNYKDKLQVYKETIHTSFGTAFHETIQEYFEKYYNDSVKAAEELDVENLLRTQMLETYKKGKEKNGGEHFSTAKELEEFYEDGVHILREWKKKKGGFIQKRGWHLAGIEIPIMITPEEEYGNTLFKGFIDAVLYHEDTETFKIIDFKTSTRGWNKNAKKDVMKQNQLILYKEFFSRQFNVPKEKIEVSFVIVKRKIWEESEFPQPRISEFRPASGPIKTKKAINVVREFIEGCFEKNGSYKEREFEMRPSQSNCRFCAFADKPELCSRGRGA